MPHQFILNDVVTALKGMSTDTEFPSGDAKVVKIFTDKAPVRELALGHK